MDGTGPASVTWSGGVISGDERVVSSIESLVERREILPMAVPAEVESALQPDSVALRTMVEVFDPGWEVQGHAPDPPWYRDPTGTVY